MSQFEGKKTKWVFFRKSDMGFSLTHICNVSKAPQPCWKMQLKRNYIDSIYNSLKNYLKLKNCFEFETIIFSLWCHFLNRGKSFIKILKKELDVTFGFLSITFKFEYSYEELHYNKENNKNIEFWFSLIIVHLASVRPLHSIW